VNTGPCKAVDIVNSRQHISWYCWDRSNCVLMSETSPCTWVLQWRSRTTPASKKSHYIAVAAWDQSPLKQLTRYAQPQVCKPACSELVLKPTNKEGCGRKGIWHKKYLEVHGWAYSHSHLCGCCRPANGHTVRTASERGPAINQGAHHIQK